MKSEKENYYIKEILKILVQGDIVATGKIASMIALSEKATRNKLEHLQNYLQENQLGSIEKKPRVGIWLSMDEQQKEKMLRLLDGAEHFSVGYDATQRVRETLQIFFRMMPRETITTQKLAEELYLSPPTVLKVMKDCEKWLAPYGIEISNERSRGCSLKYDETSYRIALKDYIMLDHDLDETRRQTQDFFYSIDIDLIKKAIIETENEWNYRFTDTSFYEILIYCCLAYQRKDFSTPLRIAQEDQEILERYNEYPFTIAIFKKLHEKMHVIFSNEDVMFLATQILCSKFIGINNAVDMISNISKYDQKILNFIDEMLVTIGNILEVDLTNDSKLRESLIFHMRPTIFRLRYGSPQSNSLVNFIKTEYKTVFRAAWSISMMFENTFGLQITEDELGYIVLYIQSALERRNQRYSAILLAESNLGHAQLLSERIRKTVPEISSLKVISHHDFKLYEHPDEDIIISSKLLKETDRRIIVIPNLLSDTGIGMLRSFMDNLNLRISEEINPFEPICFQLFSPELMFINTSFDTKEELLKYMCERMELKGYVTGKFYDSVMEREKATTTSIGNRVALPHGAMSEVNESHVAIAVLPEPIVWDDDRVDVIFLLGFKMSTHEEIRRIQSFYKQYISLIETDEKVKIIRSKKSNLELYRYLIQ